MNSYTLMVESAAKRIDSHSKKYLASMLSEYSRCFVTNQINQRLYTSKYRSAEEKQVLQHCQRLLMDGWQP